MIIGISIRWSRAKLTNAHMVVQAQVEAAIMMILAHLSSRGLIVSDDGSELLLVDLRPLDHGSIVFLNSYKHGCRFLILALWVLKVFFARVKGAYHTLGVDI